MTYDNHSKKLSHMSVQTIKMCTQCKQHSQKNFLPTCICQKETNKNWVHFQRVFVLNQEILINVLLLNYLLLYLLASCTLDYQHKKKKSYTSYSIAAFYPNKLIRTLNTVHTSLFLFWGNKFVDFKCINFWVTWNMMCRLCISCQMG